MSDPWIVDGKLHPAAEKMGLPEWYDEFQETHFRIRYQDGRWGRDSAHRVPDWYIDAALAAHEAAALLEKAAREWLAALCLDVCHVDGGWIVYDWVYGTFLNADGKWGDEDEAQVFPTHTAALQAGILAAKGEDDEQDAEREGTGNA